MQKVRMGIIGTSWWMDNAHLPWLHADPQVEMAAICGRNGERAQEMAAKYGVAAVYTDYREMLASGKLDALLVAAPDDEHYAMTMAALDAGLHVICEKPLALNATDAKAMYECAEEKGVRHMAFFTWRWMPHHCYLRELIDAGLLGKVYHGQFSFMLDGGRSPDYAWRMDRRRANGVLGDMGSHMFDLARYLVGDIARVNASLGYHVQHSGPDGRPMESANDAAMALLEFESGAQGSVEVSSIARVDDPFLEMRVALYGEAGAAVAELRLGAPMRLWVARGEEPMQEVAVPERFWGEANPTRPLFPDYWVSYFISNPIGDRLFVDSILEQRAVTPSFYDGWKAQQAIDAALVSSEGGGWARLPAGL